MRLGLLDGKVAMLGGDCIEVMRTLPDDYVDAVVTDPPYHLTSISKPRPDLAGKGNHFARRQAQMSAGFMGKQWDGGDIAFRPETWAEVLRVLKPGGHLLAFGAPKNFHRLVCAIEDGGFEVRDCIQWVFSQGFPKSHDVSKGIDRMHGAEREVVGKHAAPAANKPDGNSYNMSVVGMPSEVFLTAPATPAARQWEGWGTALKPAYEPICLARKPLTGTVAQNVLTFGTGALNIDSCRVEADRKGRGSRIEGQNGKGCRVHGMRGLQDSNAAVAFSGAAAEIADDVQSDMSGDADERSEQSELGRRRLDRHQIGISPAEGGVANGGGQGIATDPDTQGISGASDGGGATDRPAASVRGARPPLERSEERQPPGELDVDGLGGALPRASAYGAEAFDARSSEPSTVRCTCGSASGALGRWPANIIHDGSDEVVGAFPETGSGARNGQRNGDDSRTAYGAFKGGDSSRLFDADSGSAARFFYTAKADADDRIGSKHPTVKPLDLMQYLVRLVCPRGGLVLDPFAGTGTTGEAAWREGCRAILIEREEEYQWDIARRMELAGMGPDQRTREIIKTKIKDKPVDLGPLFGGEAA